MRKHINLVAGAVAASALLVAIGMAPRPAGAQQSAEKTVAQEKPTIDVVFAIDCSGSMGAVIETAKQKVWTIVNEVAKAKPSPVLRIGLYGYGNADRSYRKFALSDDLDEVYKNLMTFRDEGWGDEYVGLVIDKAVREMPWSKSPRALRVVYVVGNETARQGPVDYTASVKTALAGQIVVNAVYCGNAGGLETWEEFARLAEGKYLHIAGDGGNIVIPTPFDADLARLSGSINNTYLGYGAAGRYGAANQAAQDANASAAGGAPTAAARAMSKSAGQYNNSRWDLVDAAREKDFDLGKLKAEELPEDMRKMSLEERKAHIEKLTKARAVIQEEIKTLGAKRAKYIEAEMKKSGKDPNKAFDEAVRLSIVEQAGRRGFVFEK